jgi:hypothetical protein
LDKSSVGDSQFQASDNTVSPRHASTVLHSTRLTLSIGGDVTGANFHSMNLVLVITDGGVIEAVTRLYAVRLGFINMPPRSATYERRCNWY